MQHLLREAARQRLEHGFHIITLGQTFARLGDFCLAPFVGTLVYLTDQRHGPVVGIALLQPVHEVAHAFVDDGFGLRHGSLAVGLAGLHHGGQVVHGVEVDV